MVVVAVVVAVGVAVAVVVVVAVVVGVAVVVAVVVVMTDPRKTLCIDFRVKTDSDILALLDKSGNKTGLIRACIRAMLSRDRQTEADRALIEKARDA